MGLVIIGVFLILLIITLESSNKVVPGFNGIIEK